MSIRIDSDRCIGCGACANVCPGNLIELPGPGAPKRETASGKAAGTGSPSPGTAPRPVARMAYPRDCWGCCSCVKACPVGAISLFLGADVGGRGSTLTVERRGHLLDWNIDRFDGQRTTVTVDTQQSNKY